MHSALSTALTKDQVPDIKARIAPPALQAAPASVAAAVVRAGERLRLRLGLI